MGFEFKHERQGFMKKRGWPDPLHIELPHAHKKILELVYVVAIVGAMVSIVILSLISPMSVAQADANGMLLLILAILLGIVIFEKSLVHHLPTKVEEKQKTKK